MDLQGYRARIQEIDAQMVDLFVERMQIAAEIAAKKAEQNLPVLDAERERVVLQNVMTRAGEEFAGYAKQLYEAMLDVSKDYQSALLAREISSSAHPKEENDK